MLSLIAEAVGLAAIGAVPGDSVAGEPLDPFVHAVLTNGEPAVAALPAEPV